MFYLELKNLQVEHFAHFNIKWLKCSSCRSSWGRHRQEGVRTTPGWRNFEGGDYVRHGKVARNCQGSFLKKNQGGSKVACKRLLGDESG